MSSNLITRSLTSLPSLCLETLFRWSKFIAPDEESLWETRLLMDEVSFDVENSVQRKRVRLSSYCETPGKAEALCQRYGGSVKVVLPEDWMPRDDPSRSRLTKIRDRLIVTETGDLSWIEKLQKQHSARQILSFPPQLAFGTGAHPTTANCLRLLVDAVEALPVEDLRSWSFLDLGCGSGILSIAAAKLQARKVVALENDPVALTYAEANGDRHGTTGTIEFVHGDVLEWLRQPPPEPFDILAANLFSELLHQVFPLLVGWIRPGGRAIFSGFLTSQEQALRKAASQHGFTLGPGLRRGKWVAASGVARERKKRL